MSLDAVYPELLKILDEAFDSVCEALDKHLGDEKSNSFLQTVVILWERDLLSDDEFDSLGEFYDAYCTYSDEGLAGDTKKLRKFLELAKTLVCCLTE